MRALRLPAVWPPSLGDRFAHVEALVLRPLLALAMLPLVATITLATIDVSVWILVFPLAGAVLHLAIPRARWIVPLLGMIGWTVPILAVGSGRNPLALAYLLEIAFGAMRLSAATCARATSIACVVLAWLAAADAAAAGRQIALAASGCMLATGAAFTLLVRSFKSSRRAGDPLEVAFLAHGIKNSLSGVAGFAQLLDSDLEPGDPRRRLTQRIRTGIEEAHGRLADLAQGPRPSLAVREVRAELASVANGVLERCSGLLQSHSIRCTNSIPPDLHVRMDGAALDAILHDLVQNAIDAMQTCGGELVLDASPNPPRLWVRDSGPGVDTALRSKIFEPGFSNKGTSRGLGLCRVRALVAAHGGTIQVSSAAQGGAEFELGFATAPPSNGR